MILLQSNVKPTFRKDFMTCTFVLGTGVERNDNGGLSDNQKEQTVER